MGLLAYLLCSVGLLTTRQVPAGTRLEVRLTSAVGSYSSKIESPVHSVLIAPVIVGGETLLPAGTILSGSVQSVRKVGLGIVHETASIDLEFDRLTLPDHETLPISARVTQVENGRESVGKDGSINAGRSTSSLSYRGSGYIRTLIGWNLHAQLALWAVKTLIVQVPEAEIYYPAGVELALVLREPVTLISPSEPEDAPRKLTAAEHDRLDELASAMSNRTTDASKRPADGINLLFIGSRERLSEAFRAAGWVETPPKTFRGLMHGIQAVAEGRGYPFTPMSPLLLDDATADMSWQKGLNDVGKRHHVRIWKQDATWDGQDVWIGAGTRDVNFAYLRPGQKLTHRIEEDVDQERDKIAYDLAFTSCVSTLDWTDRPYVSHFTRSATGDPMSTDARLAVIGFGDCSSPRFSTETSDLAPVPAHGRKLQRFVRREILSMRNDILRDNLYWRSYEGIRMTINALRRRNQPPQETMVADAKPKMPLNHFVALR